MELSATYIALLIATGFIAGIINTLAGGGSNLTLPALMIMGMPADVANATNRVAVFMQGIVGVKGFHRAGKIKRSDVLPVLTPTLIGGLIGGLLASFSPESYLKPLLLMAMVSMTVVMLVKPSVIVPPEGTKAFSVSEKPSAWYALFLAGIYGGFVQAGVGFVLIAALAGTLRYDLVTTNALKMVCTLSFTLLALIVFIWNDQVRWQPGLILAVGTMLGSMIAVKFAIRAKTSQLKWFLFIMTVIGSLAALLSE